MPNKIQFKRGLKEDLPSLGIGEPAFCIDTKELFVGAASGNAKMSSEAINVKWFGIKGDNTTDDYSAANSLLNYIGSDKVDIYLPKGTYIIGTNITISANVNLIFANGAILAPKTGVTITLNCGIQAGCYQIFSGEGTIISNTSNILVINPMWFGAKTDGSDCSDSIYKSAEFLQTTGGTIRFPNGGWWTISSTINIKRNNIKIEGSGMAGQTTLTVLNQNFNIFNITGTGVEIANIRILGSGVPTGGYAFYITGNDSNIHDVSLNIVFHGIYQSGSNIRMDDITIVNFKDIGISFECAGHEVGMVKRIFMNNVEGSEPTVGILLKECSAIQFIQCEIINTGIGCWMNPDGVDGNVFSTTFTDCYFDSCINQGLLMQPTGANGAVVRTRIVNSWFGENSVGLDVRAGKCKGITITNTDFYNNKGSGINIDSGANVETFGITNSNIAGNIGSGISIGANVSNFIINGNTIGAAGDMVANQYGIYINAGTSDNYIIVNNIIKGNTNGQLIDGGTGTNKVVANNLT